MNERGTDGIRYFWGADTYGARAAITEIAEGLSATIQWLTERQLLEQPLREWLSQSQSLFNRHLFVIRDPSSFSKALQSTVTDQIQPFLHTTWILWDREVPDKRSSLFKALRSVAREFPLVSGPALEAWLNEEIERQHASCASGAARVLVERVGTNRWRLASEIARLALRATVITPTLVREECPQPVSGEIFAALDALSAGRGAVALKAIEGLLAQGMSEFYVLSMLAYQFRTMLMVQSGVTEGRSYEDIARQGKLHPFVVQKNAAVLQRWPARHLIDSLARVLATDTAIKQGKVDAKSGLLMLTLALARR